MKTLDCKKLDKMMMKYMDNTLSHDEGLSLSAHLLTCEKCFENFMVCNEACGTYKTCEAYNKSEFFEANVFGNDISNISMTEEGFEETVMAKILRSGDLYDEQDSLLDNILTAIAGFFSAILGLSVVHAANIEYANRLVMDKVFGKIVGFIQPLFNFINVQSVAFFNSAANSTISAIQLVVALFMLLTARYLYAFKNN